MKKTVILFAFAIAIISCNKAAETKEFKTAYIDTSKLMEESTEAKDIEAKYKERAKVMGSELEAEIARFKSEAASFQADAQKNGQAWAQQKGAQLQQKQDQLRYAQDELLRKLQQESGVEMDTLVKGYRKVIKDYGKQKGYDYIYGSGEQSPSILYAKDGYDISKDVIKMINDKYTTDGKKEDAPKEEKK